MSFATACELHHITQMEELSIFTQAHGDNKKSLCYLRRNHILGNKLPTTLRSGYCLLQLRCPPSLRREGEMQGELHPSTSWSGY